MKLPTHTLKRKARSSPPHVEILIPSLPNPLSPPRQNKISIPTSTPSSTSSLNPSLPILVSPCTPPPIQPGSPQASRTPEKFAGCNDNNHTNKNDPIPSPPPSRRTPADSHAKRQILTDVSPAPTSSFIIQDDNLDYAMISAVESLEATPASDPPPVAVSSEVADVEAKVAQDWSVEVHARAVLNEQFAQLEANMSDRVKTLNEVISAGLGWDMTKVGNYLRSAVNTPSVQALGEIIILLFFFSLY